MTLLECRRCGARELVDDSKSKRKRALHRTQRECITALAARVTELERLTKHIRATQLPARPEEAVTQEIPLVKVDATDDTGVKT